jgi:hypothetical protein
MESCIWCGSKDTQLLREAISRYREYCFDIWSCSQCDCRFSPWGALKEYDYAALQSRHAWYRLTECDAQMVRNILANGPEPFWINWASRYLNAIPWLSDRRHRAILESMIRAACENRPLRIIEVGCNRGMIGGMASRLGHNYLGVDFAGATLDNAIRDFSPFGARFEAVDASWFYDGLIQEQYDLVYSSEVVEHTPAPGLFCKRLLDLVAPMGKLIFTTPDLEWAPEYLWPSDLPPIHTVLLRKHSVQQLLIGLAPGAAIEYYNEDFGPSDTVPQLAEPSDRPIPLLAAEQTVDMDPGSDAFPTYVGNVGYPFWPVEPRYDALRDRAHDLLLADALMAGRRKTGTSMVVEVSLADSKQPPSAGYQSRLDS